ncbi:hypothetical protein BJX99DRAFT_255403 [Aspergillus californicus]
MDRRHHRCIDDCNASEIAIVTKAGVVQAGDIAPPYLEGYIKDTKLRYGFITTYEETIFVKQECRNGQWILLYSRPIRSDIQRPTYFTKHLGQLKMTEK